MTFLPTSLSKETLLKPKSQKMVMRLVRRCDQDERETDGAVHWISMGPMGPKLRKAFLKSGGRKFSVTDWLQHVYAGSNKMTFQYCTNSKHFFVYSCYSRHWWFTERAWVDGSRHYMERIPVSTRMFVWCHFNSQIRTKKEDPVRGQSRRRRTWRWPIKTETKTLSQQMEKYSGRRPLDQFGPSTRQRITILADNSVPADCIYKVISQKRRTNFIRKTLDASSHTDDCTWECLAIATLAAAAARHLWECVFKHQETSAESAESAERGTR